MNRQSGWLRKPWLVVMIVGLLAVPDLEVLASAGHRSGGGSRARAPRAAAPRRSSNSGGNKAVRMPRAVAATHAKVTRNTSGQTHARSTANPSIAGTNTHAKTNAAIAGTALGTNSASHTLTYGTGKNARHYQARGYGRGYSNRSYGRSYGNSQASTRAVVSRLRSVHSSLARIDHDYQGHRVKAMHSITLAIRQLSHRSMSYGSSSGMNANNNNMLAMGRGQGNVNNNAQGANRQGRLHLSQAQSDARMSQALRTSQGIQMQLSQQGTNSTSHSRARGHVQVAVREMGHALTIR